MNYKTPQKFTFCLLFAMLLSACQQATPVLQTDSDEPNSTHNPAQKLTSYRCKQPKEYLGKAVGDGHCVAFVNACARTPFTKHWRPGKWVQNSNIEAGTIIATFVNDRYTSVSGQHAAIYIEHAVNGIWVYDQWLGKKASKRLIKYQNQPGVPAANKAQEYRVVLSAKY